MHAGGDPDADRGACEHPPAARAGVAHGRDVVPAAVAGVARVDLEQTQVRRLRDPCPPARAVAHDALRRGHPARHARSEAAGADERLLDLDRLRGAALGLVPLELEARRGERRARAPRRPPTAEPEPVVEAAPLRMREHLVRRDDVVERLDAGRRLGHVGMKAAGEPAKCPLDLLVGRAGRHAEDVVVVLLEPHALPEQRSRGAKPVRPRRSCRSVRVICGVVLVVAAAVAAGPAGALDGLPTLPVPTVPTPTVPLPTVPRRPCPHRPCPP